MNWDDPGDDSVSGYRIERRGDGDGADQFVILVEDSGSTAVQYVDSTVAPESGYFYRVRALNGSSVSEPSAEIGVFTASAPLRWGSYSAQRGMRW